MAAGVLVLASDPRLRSSLVAALRSFGPVGVLDPQGTCEGKGLTVVAPSSDCSPGACERLVEAGQRVVILAAVVRENERLRYERAGAAAYVPMAVDRTLIDILAVLNRDGTVPSATPEP